jgi:hypothetical protein
MDKIILSIFKEVIKSTILEVVIPLIIEEVIKAFKALDINE